MLQYSRFLSISSCRWPTCGSSSFQDSFSSQEQEVALTYSLIRPPERPLAHGKGRVLIPGYIRFLPMLAICEVAHSLQLLCEDWDFSFTEDETRRHFSYLSGTFRENFIVQLKIIKYIIDHCKIKLHFSLQSYTYYKQLSQD